MRRMVFRLVQFAAAAVVLGFLVWSSYSAVQFLRTSPRFEVRRLTVSGLKRVDEDQLVARAHFEVGTNIFAADLNGVRERVEELQWVRYAVVQRVMPDEIVIKVIEREPIGLARIRGEIYQFDNEGVVLDAPPGTTESFPVLDGLRFEDPPETVSKKVDVYRRVVEELGQTELSEVHVNEAGEAAVVSTSDPLMVNLGAGEFKTRWLVYLQLKTQIQQQYPDAVLVDLRFRNQVVVRMRNDEVGEKVIWDAEKRLL